MKMSEYEIYWLMDFLLINNLACHVQERIMVIFFSFEAV